MLWAAFAASLAAPPAAGEMFRWVDAQGRVHYSDQPQAGAKAVELQNSIQVTKPTDSESAASSDTVQRARQKRREIQRWADREARKRERQQSAPLGPIGQRQRYAPGLNGRDVPLGKSPATIKEESCRRRYGKSCGELEQSRAKARADCERRGRDCDRPEALAKQRPRTLDEQAEIATKRAKRRARQDRRSERAIETLKRRGQLP